MALRKSLLSEYQQVAIKNLQIISRTARDGSIDVSSAGITIPESCKDVFSLHSQFYIPSLCEEEFSKFNLTSSQISDLQISNEKIAVLDVLALINMPRNAIRKKVIHNFTISIEYAFNRSLFTPLFKHYSEVKEFIATIAMQLGDGIVLSGKWLRCHDSDTFPVYTLAKDLHEAFEEFCQQFYEKLNALQRIDSTASKYESAVDIAAWVEYRVNLTDHFIADGCGKTAAVISSFIYMVASIKSEYMPLINRSGYFNKNVLPKIRRGTDSAGEKAEFHRWLCHYRKEFFLRSNSFIRDVGLFTNKTQELLLSSEPHSPEVEKEYKLA
jgi:hypothetical protein